jgi:hypothetical protein
MGTRSSITVYEPETRTHHSIYCHWDGYISNNGVLLQENYNSLEKAMALVEGGYISSLGASIECPEGHSFDNRVKGHTVYYKRDRGESDVDAVSFKSLEACLRRTSQGYDYLYRDGKWWVHTYFSDYKDANGKAIYSSTVWLWTPLAEAIVLDAEFNDSDSENPTYKGYKKFR